MPFLIDGHNLIPKTRAMQLSDIDDEMELVSWLQVFCRVRHSKVEVFFDGAPAGQAGTRRFGQVTAHFVRLGIPADEAILLRLRKLGRAARNWTVVSSDQHIQTQARAMLARVVSAEAFAADLIQAQRTQGAGAPSNEEFRMSEREIEDWLRLFDRSNHQED